VGRREAGGSEFEASIDYEVRVYLKKKRKEEKEKAGYSIAYL
jgi:hypothetical protein